MSFREVRKHSSAFMTTWQLARRCSYKSAQSLHFLYLGSVLPTINRILGSFNKLRECGSLGEECLWRRYVRLSPLWTIRFIFHEPHNLKSGLSSTLIFHFFFSCPFFLPSSSFNHLTPCQACADTQTRAHTPLILLTSTALRKDIQYVHWRQNSVVTILQNDNHRQPGGIRRYSALCFL